VNETPTGERKTARNSAESMSMRKRLRLSLVSLPRPAKRFVLMANDAVLLPLALWSAFALRLGQFAPDVRPFWWMFLLVPALALPLFAMQGLYRPLIRYLGASAVAS